MITINKQGIHELERALVRTLFEHTRQLPKAKALENYQSWQSSNAMTIFAKLIQHMSVLRSEIEVLGEEQIPTSTIESAVKELMDFDYMERISTWLVNIDHAKQSDDITLLTSLIENRPLQAGIEKYITMKDSLGELQEALKASQRKDSRIVHMPFNQMRSVIGDLGPAHLMVVAGEPGSLKSGFSEQFDLFASLKHSGGIFSLEMVRTAKLARYAQHIYGDSVGPRAIQTGSADVTLLNKAIEELKRRKLYIDDKPENIIELMHAMEVMEFEVDPDYYSVDFLQVLTPLPGQTEYEAVKYNIKKLYNFSKKVNKPVIVLSQLNREARKDQFAFNTGKKIEKTPKMSDLEGAGTIEQLAHSILFISRDDEDPEIRKLFLAKNRNGQAPYNFGKIPVYPEYMNFIFDINLQHYPSQLTKPV